ncbi:hypothetical protein OC25_03945 [Pedobacter kyungheensis]|uniref:Uncharacterized protein n=1 Tax=Pedobacter kyungheensis TaxID=1069985 RepID=A0A0C1FTI5_9SPHI|nr:hypothetical protein [Pedobacter kyungheensis]KIA96237.1 hypothetical protein OC25_03945 [Pedobacter kyungheensis]
MGRIINAESHLRDLLSDGQDYYIGFGIDQITEIGKDHLDLNDLINGKTGSFTVSGKKGPLKENVKGKFVRKQPERKETIEKHIEYYSNYHGKIIEYDREFHIWEKEMAHRFELKLYRHMSPQQEMIIHFPLFNMVDDETHFLRAKAAMNICVILGGYYMIYDSKFEPALRITQHLGRKVLQSGIGTMAEKIDEIKDRLIRGDYGSDNGGNSYRFAVLEDYNASDIADGIGGFNEYLRFEFEQDDIVILENLRSGNATYVFRLSLFDKDFVLDKQTARNHKSFLDRVVHHNVAEWERMIGRYLKRKAA